MHLIEMNPAARVRVTDKRRAKDKRREFTPEALKAIFSSPVYTQGARPKAGGGEAAYWLPLLGLYSGARLNELGQLHPEDVMQEAYTDPKGKEHQAWVIRLEENRERGQELKNEGSERRIPVHADLIKLGFIDYANAAKAAGRTRLFPDLNAASDGKLTGNWSKWFGRYRRKELGLTGKDTPFHSFRHTFKHYARLAGIAAEVHNEITGHETGDVADAYGGLSYPLFPLVQAMKAYKVPGLTLPKRPERLRP
jgi:integrase